MGQKVGGGLAVGRVFVLAYLRAGGQVVDAHTRAYPGDARFLGGRCSFSYVRGSRLETRLAALERRAELVLRRRAGGLPCAPTSVPMEQT
jgi:hypothetical protein